MDQKIRTVSQLKDLIKNLPDDLPIVVADPKNGLSFKYGIVTDADCEFNLHHVGGVPPNLKTADGTVPVLYFSGPA